MKKNLKILLFITLFASFFSVNAENIPVEKVFKDIDKNYKYYDELQSLYDRWIFSPDKNWNFNKKDFLNRDEFVWIVSEISCSECVAPNTDLDLVKKHFNKNTFFDVNEENKFFYCIADALDTKKITWYQAWTICQDWTWKNWEKPFCPKNNIILEEALAIILRSWNLLSIEEAEKIRKEIENWKKFKNILNISPKLSNWSVYSFFPDFKKAYEFNFKDFDKDWNQRNLKLLDFSEKINPKKFITKEDFLRISYIALKNNSCKAKDKNDFWLKIDIFDKNCNPWNETFCEITDFPENEKIFDLSWKISNISEKWFVYNWRIYDYEKWKEILKNWNFVDNFNFEKPWKYRIFLIANHPKIWKSQVFTDINIKNWDNSNDYSEKTNENWNLKINIFDQKCSNNISFCKEKIFPNDERTFDFSWNWWTSDYSWTFKNISNWKVTSNNWKDIDNKNFPENWTYEITLNSKDLNWKNISTKKIINIWWNSKNNSWSDSNNWEKKDKNWLTSFIIVDKISATVWEKINFIWKTNFWKNPTYFWDFWNWKTWYWKEISHNFTVNWTYKITLKTTDKNWENSSANVNVKISNTPWFEWNWKDTDKDWVPDENDFEINTPAEKKDFICKIEHIKNKKYNCKENDLWVYNPNIEKNNNWKDNDWDWIPNNLDLCKDIKWEKNNSWCPIFEKKCSIDSDCDDSSFCEEWYCKLKNYNHNCAYNWGNLIIWKAECNSCPCDTSIDFNASLRSCDIIFPAITSPDKKDIYSKWKYFQIKKVEN